MAKERDPKDLMVNLAEDIKLDDLNEIGSRIGTLIQNDINDRMGWATARKRWLEMHLVRAPNRIPQFPGGANVAMPIIAAADLEFQSRSYAALFEQPYPQRVRSIPIEKHDTIRARRAEKYINFQLIVELEEYESEWDRLLMEIPIMGTAFTKTFWCMEEDRPKILFVPSENVIVPFRSPSLKRAPRVAERTEMRIDELLDQERAGFLIDIEGVLNEGDVKEENQPMTREPVEDISGETKGTSETNMPGIFEVETNLMLPGDSEPKPYTLWISETKNRVHRITKRAHEINGKKVKFDKWTDYHFIPNPEGFYSLGYAHFLEPIQRTANTIVNQAIDAARMSNNPFAFVGRGAGLRRRHMKLHPGAIIDVNDAQQVQVAKLPGMDQALFQLMGVLQQFGDNITSRTDEIQGKVQKGVRDPTVRGTLARIEQGLVGFGVIIKRIMRQQRGEYQKLTVLNQMFVEKEKVFRVLGSTAADPFEKVERDDFGAKMSFFSTADPSFASPQQRRAESMQIMEVALKHPLLIGNPETGEGMNAPAQLQFLRDFLRTYDKSDLLTSIPEVPEPEMPPDEENQQMKEGIEIKPKPTEDDIAHLERHQAYREETGSNKLLDAHIVAHQRQAAEKVRAQREALQQPQPAQPGAQNGAGAGPPGGAPAGLLSGPQ